MDSSKILLKIQSTTKNVLENMQNTTFIVHAITIFMIITLITLFIVFVTKTMRKNTKNCNKMSNMYNGFPKIGSFNVSGPQANFALRDFYIKTAYNACSAGKYSGDFVNTCALKNVIKQGARCLDFQIFSNKNRPIIATSTTDNYYTKQTYNEVQLRDALTIIADYAFSASTCPNFNDPLILHFRIMSNNRKIYDDMAQALSSAMKYRLLGVKYSYENGRQNLGSVTIKDLMGKVIIMVDGTNKMYEQTKLNEYVNMTSGSAFMRGYSYDQIKNIHDYNELIAFNKKNMTLVKPEGSKNSNPSAALAMKYGCQLVAMAFQTGDANMTYYTDIFNKEGSAFILKPEQLRYVPVTIPTPPPPPKELSYQKRDIKSDFYKFNI
jgi:hypothetical protein